MDTSRFTTTPATARTDLATGRGLPAERHDGLEPATIRRLGLGLAAGAVAWAISTFVFAPTADGMAGRIGDLTGLLFQLGVFCLLTVQIRTRAIGTSRAAMAMLKVEVVLLALASVWSLLHGILPDGVNDAVWLGILDAFWPLSMLGMFVISIKLVFAHRWKGALRWWPLIAESWAIVTVPSFLVFGDSVSRWVGGGHLLIGYAVLGLILARRPELAFAEEDSDATRA